MTVTRAELVRVFREVARLAPDDLAGRYDLSHGEAERGRVALVELKAFLEITQARRIAFPEAAMLDGMILDAAGASEAAARTGEPPLWRQIDSAALALGRKYRFDERHARHVQTLALELFDGLRDVCGLDRESRLYLSVAALLHDIGTFVSDQGHHRHSAYLIRSSEILGLSQADLDAIALVARSHRKAVAPSGPDLAVLPPTRRVEVIKLAALLRIADALDREHLTKVREVQCRIEKGRVTLAARGDGDLALSLWTASRKADLFEEVFEIDARVEGAEHVAKWPSRPSTVVK